METYNENDCKIMKRVKTMELWQLNTIFGRCNNNWIVLFCEEHIQIKTRVHYTLLEKWTKILKSIIKKENALRRQIWTMGKCYKYLNKYNLKDVLKNIHAHYP